MQGFGAFLKSLGAARIVAMGAVTVALMGFFAFLILRVTAPQMTTLFTDLTFEDSAAIVKDWLDPQLTEIAPLGLIEPCAAAEAVMVSTSIAKLAAMEWSVVTLVKP